MRKLYAIFVPILLATGMGSGNLWAADNLGGENETLPITLYLDGATIQPNLVDIGYEINYPGFLEFHLFNKDGKRIFLTSMVKGKGKHAIKLKKNKLESAHTYTYYFFYKGKEYHGTFKV